MSRTRVVLTVLVTIAMVAALAATMLARDTRTLFAQDGVNFLEEEAGAAMYMDAGQTLDLSKARSCYNTIEKETGTYIIGSMSLPDLPETEDVHCFVHVDGWMVTYYLKAEPLSKVVAWEYYSGGELTVTKLDRGLTEMCSHLQVPVTEIKKYHFQFPSANNWMIVTESNSDGGTFNLQIPSDFTVYERSWSHWASWGLSCNSYLKINDNTINHMGFYDGTYTNYGELSYGDLPPGDTHEVSVSGCSSRAAIGLVYFEP